MKRTIFTGFLGILTTSPLMAAVGDTNFTPNQNVASSCNIDMLSISSGTALTNANFTPLTYSCAAGTYLPDGDTWESDSQYTTGNCAQCTAGSYCAGSGNDTFTYSEANDQGITSCGNTYTHSDAGSDSVDDCYRDCTAADVAHLKSGGSVTGRYYSTGTNECSPADRNQCATGYHYVANGVDLNDAIGDAWATSGPDYEGYITDTSLTVSVEYSDNKGSITVNAQCSTLNVTNPWYDNNDIFAPDHFSETLPDSNGQVCWCQIIDYTPYNGTTQPLSALWVYRTDYTNDPVDCRGGCVDACAEQMSEGPFRAAMFSAVKPDSASCEANTVSINWKDAAGETHELGSCTYDGTLTTPTTAPKKRGHTFGGWKFVAQ